MSTCPTARATARAIPTTGCSTANAGSCWLPSPTLDGGAPTIGQSREATDPTPEQGNKARSAEVSGVPCSIPPQVLSEVERGEASFPRSRRPCWGVVGGIDEAARKVFSGTSGTVRLTIVTDAPPCVMLVEPVVCDLCWSRSSGESDDLTRVTIRVRTELLLPTVDAEPTCINCSLLPTRSDVVVGQVPGALDELTLERSVAQLFAFVTLVGPFVVRVVQPRVEDDGGCG